MTVDAIRILGATVDADLAVTMIGSGASYQYGEADLNLAISATVKGSYVGVTPPERIFVVPQETRSARVLQETRTGTVEQETRINNLYI
jgi:hypothetical protein